MNIKHIRYFASVFTHGSLSAAAKEQYVTVQAVSKAVADLERELGHDLFIRESRGMSPTPFGKSFYLKAESVLRSFDELEEFATFRGEGSVALRLVLCTPFFRGHQQACASIAAFIEKNLGISATVVVMPEHEASEALHAGQVDALLSFGSHRRDDMDVFVAGTVAPGVLMAQDHPLKGHRLLTIDDIAPFDVFVTNGFEGCYGPLVSEYAQRGLNIKRVAVPTSERLDCILHDHGLIFVIGIPSIDNLYPDTEVHGMASEDAVAISLCLLSPTVGKSSTCRVLERWLASEVVRLEDPSSRAASMVADLRGIASSDD